MTLRTRIILLVLGVALLPLALLGWWLSGSAARSGEALLSARLQSALDRSSVSVTRSWNARRSQLLDLADSSGLLADGRLDTAALARAAEALEVGVVAVAISDTLGRPVWEAARTRDGPRGDALLVSVPLFRRDDGRRVATVDAAIDPVVMLGTSENGPLDLWAIVLGAFDSRTGASLLPLPFDADLLHGRFELAGEPWLAERRSLSEPRIELVAAAPLTPFVQPFETAARRGFWLVLATSVLGLVAAIWLTTRMTMSLARLVGAADAIARGDLDRRVTYGGTDEVGRVASAFNTMAESLRRTLGELSRKESLAAVGAFASELAHEIRNPLTAIRVDLEVVDERLTSDEISREALHAALAQVERLDHTVGGALQLARSGDIKATAVDVRDVAAAAVRASAPAFASAGASLALHVPDQGLIVDGDPRALQQMLLNILLNAAQAMATGGEATLEVDAQSDQIEIRVRDNGCGMPPDVLARAREPFFTRKKGGTGLGVGIAERIALAHRGQMEIESEAGRGTLVRVRIPRSPVGAR
jgi:signal transduction histidine kinase